MEKCFKTTILNILIKIQNGRIITDIFLKRKDTPQ